MESLNFPISGSIPFGSSRDINDEDNDIAIDNNNNNNNSNNNINIYNSAKLLAPPRIHIEQQQQPQPPPQLQQSTIIQNNFNSFSNIPTIPTPSFNNIMQQYPISNNNNNVFIPSRLNTNNNSINNNSLYTTANGRLLPYVPSKISAPNNDNIIIKTDPMDNNNNVNDTYSSNFVSDTNNTNNINNNGNTDNNNNNNINNEDDDFFPMLNPHLIGEPAEMNKFGSIGGCSTLNRKFSSDPLAELNNPLQLLAHIASETQDYKTESNGNNNLISLNTRRRIEAMSRQSTNLPSFGRNEGGGGLEKTPEL